jgi:Las1-like
MRDQGLSAETTRRNKRLRSATVLSPALSGTELDAVGQSLLSQDPALMGPALERVAVWRVRTPQLPHAIESTAALSQVLYREKTSTTGPNPSTTTELRLAYASAVLRAINGLADTLQQKRAVACSVAALCGELGVPGWLVDLRHEATHNQLPPLSTLRMAASALLQYFAAVYWDPLAESRADAHDRVMQLLKDYAAVTSQLLLAETEEGEGDAIPNTPEASDNEEVEGPKCWHLNPGIQANPFAILMEVKSKKKNSKRKTEEAPKKASAQCKKKKPRIEPGNPTPHQCAHQIVKAKKIPIDIVFATVLDFLVPPDREQGALFLSGANFVKQYRTLLAVLGRSWPGFLSALLIRCVDALLDGTADARLHCFLSDCIRFLLSRKFLVQVLPAAKEADTNWEFVPLTMYRMLQFPLNALCDRCSLSRSEKVPASAVQSVQLLLSSLLGAERVSNFGVDVPTMQPNNDVPETFPNDNTERMSLEELELMLFAGSQPGKTLNSTNSNNAATKSVTPKWVRCTAWEPCAIGTLPGAAFR